MSEEENEKPKTGRPEKKIDEDHLYKLAQWHVPVSGMAAILGVHEATLTRRYADLIEKGRQETKGRLRAKQIEVALSGNATMLIFLGKNMLDQSDRSSVELLESIPDDELERKVRGILSARGIKKIESDENR